LEEDPLSAEMKARSNSFVEAVEKAGVLTVVLALVGSLETVVSMPTAACAGVVKKLNTKARRASHNMLRILFMSIVRCVHLDIWPANEQPSY